MECKIEGFDRSVQHVKKRHLKGIERTAVSKKLVVTNILACEWRRTQANRLISRIGDEVSPHVYSGCVLRKAKQERQDHLLAVESTDVYESLQLRKYSARFEGAIKRIGLDPFFVYYCTKEQETVFYNYHNTVYIDGTGSIVKKIKLPNVDLCPHIYLYQIVAQVDDKTVPVCQMISAAHSTNDILMWLEIFCHEVSAQSSRYLVPKETVTDFDKALLGAVARAFAKTSSLKEYLSVCFRLLNNPSDSCKVPPCLLRLDIAHFTNMIARWKCFSDKPKGVRNFYLRAVAILRKQVQFEEFTQIVRSILVLALNANGEAGGLAEESRLYLSSHIRGDTLPGLSDEDLAASLNHDVTDEPLSDSNYLENSDSYQWVSDMYRECTNVVDAEPKTDEINGYYCLAFAKKLRGLLAYFPLFSEVMRGVFNYGSANATSAAVESEFIDLKHRTLRNVSLPLRADKFVGRHILSFTGKIKLALAGKETANEIEDADMAVLIDDQSHRIPEEKTSQTNNSANTKLRLSVTEHKRRNKSIPKTTKFATDTCARVEHAPSLVSMNISELHNFQNDEQITPVEIPSPKCENVPNNDAVSDLEIEEMRAEHNWRNKNDKKSKRFRYADPCPLFTTSSSGFVSLPVIPNGRNCPNVRDSMVTICLTNTCGFDSICQIIASLACNNILQKKILTDGSSPIFGCVYIFIDEGLSACFFRERAKILINIKQLKPEHRRRNIVSLNASSNIGNLTTYLLENDPSCTVITRCAIFDAHTVRSEAFISVNYDVISEEGPSQLLKAIEHGRHPPKQCCQRPPIIEVQYGPLLFIETVCGSKNVALSDFPDCLPITRERQYTLAGVIGYVGTYNFKSVGHYTSYLKVGEQWLFCNNATKNPKAVVVDRDTQLSAPMCIYAIK